jgi:alkylation response protein AidB-like acyl-CoA dehydrogenase
MREYAVGRTWADSRIQSIFGGTTEIQKKLIARGLGPRPGPAALTSSFVIWVVLAV